tara:strand:- start:302 stop:655 length:354 start_codon:yes stop_codon:yes gene_type:complete
MKLILENWREYMNESLRDSLVKTGKKACGYMNCKLFVQIVTGNPKLNDLPSRPFTSEDDLEVGDILKWGTGLHYAIWIGEGEVMEVEAWGEEPRTVTLQTLLDEMDPPDTIYSTAKG